MNREARPAGFYVYQLADPRTGLPFYVGKGQGNRAWEHERLVRTGRTTGNSRKDERIKRLHAAGLLVEVQIVEVFDLESDALELEWRIVDADPTLTNVLPGGFGRIISPEELERRGAARRIKITALRAAEKTAAFDRRIERRRASVLKGAVTDRHKAEVEAWADGIKDKRQFVRVNSLRPVEQVMQIASAPEPGSDGNRPSKKQRLRKRKNAQERRNQRRDFAATPSVIA